MLQSVSTAIKAKIDTSRRAESKKFQAWFITNPLLVGLVFLAVGIILRERFGIAIPYLAVMCVAAIILLASFIVRSPATRILTIWSLCGLIVLLGSWVHDLRVDRFERDLALCPAPDDWQPVHLRGVVDSIPAFRPDTSPFVRRSSVVGQVVESAWVTSVDILCDAVLNRRGEKHQAIPLRGKLRLWIPGRHRQLLPGTEVDCLIKWRLIAPPSNPGQIDTAKRLRQQGIFTQGFAKTSDQIEVGSWRRWWFVSHTIGRIAMAGDRAIERYVGTNQAPLASALVLGQRSQIEWELQESLLETGTIHMLAISGLHVEMVALSITGLCLVLRVGPRSMLIIICGSVIVYALICDARPPVIRASALVVIYAVARLVGFRINSINALSFVALGLLVWRTDHLWDTGTQLSFLAVAMLICVASVARQQPDELDELLEQTASPAMRWTRSLLRYSGNVIAASGWVWLVTTPIAISTFHIMAPAAIVMNLLLIIPLWLSLISGLMVALFGSWLPLVGYPLGWICSGSLWITQAMVEATSQIPGSHFWVPAPPTWWLIGFYILLVSMLAWLGFATKARRWIFITLLLWLVFGTFPWLDIFPNSPLIAKLFSSQQDTRTSGFAMTFVDVGHGTSIIVQTPEHECWLYDAGKMGDPDKAFYPMANCLWAFQIKRIDRLILSHADADHFNAVEALSKRFAIGQVVTTQRFLHSSDTAMRPVLKLLQKREFPTVTPHAGEFLHQQAWSCQVLHPQVHETEATDNADSLTLLMQYAGRTILLPGDLEGEGTRRMLRGPPTKVDVLMAPHHGSLADSPAPLLGWCKPKHVVISGGTRATRQSVRDAFAANGAADVWITAADHAIRIEIDPDGRMRMLHWIADHWEPLEYASHGDIEELGFEL